ncbi:MAG: hypothetical protein SVY10_10205, partial [Thermodesulfobacteriota bacterium]|nr:hypothetical protein [Thermodesulfobacteriota bacterium]
MDSTKEEIKLLVKESYAQAAKSSQCESSGGCCGGFIAPSEIFELGKALDYTEDQLAIGLGEANLGLGCGNPLAMADLQCGETVLDLGSGAGYDAFLAAKSIGPTIYVHDGPLDLNYWAASALFLEPGQTYELRLTLTDPDGG